VEGRLNGVRGIDSSIHSVAGVNVPISKMSNACWSAASTDTNTTASSAVFDVAAGNRFILGEDGPDGSCKNGVANAEEIWNIDTKIDDGKPATGKLFPYYRQECTNATGSADMNATYDLDDTDRGCSFYFTRPF
jgi:hypothetical protein